MTVAERIHVSRVVGLGCIVCGEAAHAHHIRHGQGMAQRAPHSEVIGLCPNHHQGPQGIHTLGTRKWEGLFGTEENLLALVRYELGIKPGELAQ